MSISGEPPTEEEQANADLFAGEEFNSELQDEYGFDANPPPGTEMLGADEEFDQGPLDLEPDYGSGSRAERGQQEILGDVMSDGTFVGSAAMYGPTEIGFTSEEDLLGQEYGEAYAIGAGQAADRPGTEIGSGHYAQHGATELGGHGSGFIAKEGPTEIGDGFIPYEIGAGQAADRPGTELGAGHFAQDGASELGGDIQAPFEAFMLDDVSMGDDISLGVDDLVRAPVEEYDDSFDGDQVGRHSEDYELGGEYGEAYAIGRHSEDYEIGAADRGYGSEIGAAAIAKVIEKARDNRQPAPPMKAVDVDAPISGEDDWGLTDVVIGAAVMGARPAARATPVVTSPSGARCSCPKCGASIVLSVASHRLAARASGGQASTHVGASFEEQQREEDAMAAADAAAAAASAQAQAAAAQAREDATAAAGSCRCPRCGAKLMLVLAPQPTLLRHSRAPGGVHVLGAIVTSPGEDANPFPLLTQLLVRAGSTTEPRIVRVDTEASYKAFRAANSPEMAALQAKLEDHVNDPHAHGGLSDDDLSEDIEDLVHLGAAVDAAEAEKRVELFMPKHFDGLVTAWREGHSVCASLTLPGLDGDVRICTAIEPIVKCVAEMSRHASEANVPAATVVGALPSMGCVLGAATALKEMAAAAPSILQRPEAAHPTPFMIRIEPKTSPTIAALMMLASAAKDGVVQAQTEWKKLGDLSAGPIKAAMLEALQLAKVAA